MKLVIIWLVKMTTVIRKSQYDHSYSYYHLIS